MRLSKVAIAIFFLLSCITPVVAQSKNTAERLGYPRDAKLLIIHADDLAVAHSQDAASFDALDQHAASSASIMVPCPWLTEVADYAKTHPDADLGLHLTLTSEWQTYRWGPVSSKDQVPSLMEPSGYLWPETEPGKQHIKAEDAEREIRAQIKKARSMGIHPTHVDSHMGMLFERPDLFAVYVKVAREYKLPFLAFLTSDTPKELASQLTPKDVLIDGVVMAFPEVKTADWKKFYLDTIRNLKPGVTELIVHLAHDDAEMRAVTVNHPDYGAAWRQRDYDVVTSPEFKKALADNHIILIGWKDLRKLLQE
ncbi:MAG TPA: polysaccharide deacetylase family protein [Candidatus Sulfotelmatobacter sp.]|nr:polysaccharide deacetylase family protein [Candidatus Sulfotelmatobacter sp.]